MLSVQTNLLAMNADRQLKANTKKNAKTTEKLSSGYKINRAADDAAGLSMSEKMRRQIRGLHQSANNISEGIGYVQTAEGALNEVQDMLHRVNELAVKAANGTNTEQDRQYIDSEIQQLKKEMDRIFETTTFNEQRIWEPKAKKILGHMKKQAVEFADTSRYSMDITNENCGVIAYGGYKVHADKDKGINLTWTGYDGNKYETKYIDWVTLKENNYSFEMSQYFGDIADNPNNALLYKDGDPAKGGVFTQQIKLTTVETTSIDDIIACVDGKIYTVYPSARANAQFEDKSEKLKPPSGVKVYDDTTFYDHTSIDMAYRAYYASHHNTSTDATVKNNGTDLHDFDAKDDAFLIPSKEDGTKVQGTSAANGGNLTAKPTVSGSTDAAKVASAKDSTQTWTFSFYMDGVGTVTATSNRISYYSHDLADDDEQKKGQSGYWWKWSPGYDQNGNWEEKHQKSTISRTVTTKGAGTLGSAMATLYGDKDSAKPGLLTAADTGGYIEIFFNMKADTPYEYGDDGSGARLTDTSVGGFKIKIEVKSTDKEIDVLNRIQNALNDDTILDFSTESKSYDSATVHTPKANSRPIDVPIYSGTCGFYVQGGTESGQHIGITYESLSMLSMGMEKTNVLTEADSGKAIEEAKAALQIVSEQRATFGAYQNRLEHAHNVNTNGEENTQASESVLRDADIAEEIMEFSVNNILMQAGTSMLTQANQSKQSVLSLLN